MRISLVFLLLFSLPAFAQKTLGKDTFQVNVRPVLNGIINDFYQMIVHFPDFPKEIVPLIQELEALAPEKDNLREACPRLINKKCDGSLKNIREKLVRLKGLSFGVLTQLKLAQTPYLNSVSGLRFVTDFDLELENIKGNLDNTSFLLASGIPQKKETYEVIKKLDELSTLISLSIVEYVPYLYREDFRHFYFNFIHPIQEQVPKVKNFEFMNRNIHSLNFAFNLLNMNLTKRNKKTPEGMGPYLATMHNRWNSILRYYY